MYKEIEAKFIDIDKESVIKKLEGIGAIKIFDERLLRRCVYNIPNSDKGEWARVRDEVDQVTMTYKKVVSKSLDGVEEVEIIVDSFENARQFLKSIGLIEKAYQETKRMRYIIKELDSQIIEFDIDTWPGLSPWIEIEADSEILVKKYAKLLSFNWDDAHFGSADFIYELKYKINQDWINNQCKLLKFGGLPVELQSENLR